MVPKCPGAEVSRELFNYVVDKLQWATSDEGYMQVTMTLYMSGTMAGTVTPGIQWHHKETVMTRQCFDVTATLVVCYSVERQQWLAVFIRERKIYAAWLITEQIASRHLKAILRLLYVYSLDIVFAMNTIVVQCVKKVIYDSQVDVPCPFGGSGLLSLHGACANKLDESTPHPFQDQNSYHIYKCLCTMNGSNYNVGGRLAPGLKLWRGTEFNYNLLFLTILCIRPAIVFDR